MRLGERSQGQGLAQRQHFVGFVEQAAHERRADVSGMENEMQRADVDNLMGGVRRDMDRNPRTFGVRSQNAVVEEACCPISGEVELDKQQRLPDEIQFLGIDVRGCGQSRDELVGDRRGSLCCHGQWYRIG